MKDLDRAAAYELYLYADNKQEIFFDSIKPTRAALDRKIARGVFDKEKAVKAFEYVAAAAARRYAAEFGGVWYNIFNPATRRAAAENMLENYLADIA